MGIAALESGMPIVCDFASDLASLGRIFHQLDVLVLLGSDHVMAGSGGVTAYAQFLVSSLFPIGSPRWRVVILLLNLNLATVKMFGEMEFWFAISASSPLASVDCSRAGDDCDALQNHDGRASSRICGMTAAGSRRYWRVLCRFPDCSVVRFSWALGWLGTTAAETESEKSLPRAVSIPIHHHVLRLLR